MIVGGVVIGIYLRHHSQSATDETEPSENEEGYLNSGELMPPGAPIEGSGGSRGGGSGGSTPLPPTGQEGVKEWLEGEKELKPGAELPEVPEAQAPPEAVTPTFHKNDPISTPPGPAISPNMPAPAPSPVIAPAKPISISQQEKEKARREIDRLQNEISGLQNHISQLTAVIQAHPKAQQRGQWEAERNQDRANIDHKRDEITYWQAKL
jgi:hypothetical protein